MNRTEVATAVARMYSAHGLRTVPEVAGELVREVLNSDCGICSLAILEDNRASGTKPHTVPTFRGAYHAASSSVAHGLHAGQATTSDIGSIEATWRSNVTHQLEASTGKGRDWCRYLAARMWASGCVTPDMAVDEAQEPIWQDTMPERIPDSLVEAAYDYARTMATNPDLTDAEFEVVRGPWDRELQAVKA